MDRKCTLFFVLLALALVTLACGLGGGAPEPTAEGSVQTERMS